MAVGLLLLLSFASCDPVKKVMNNNKKTQAVVDNYLKNYPTTPEIKYKYLPGDTVTFLQIGIDTLYVPLYGVSDTIVREITKTINRDHYVHDTTVVTITDNVPIEAAKKSVLEKNATISDKDQQLKDLAAKNSMLQWRFWLTVSGIAVLVGGLVFLKMKKFFV